MFGRTRSSIAGLIVLVVGVGGCSGGQHVRELEGGGRLWAGSGPGALGISRERRFVFPGSAAKVQLVGMDGKAVEQILGQPSLQRRERPAQYWRYSYGECAIDLYFYKDGDEGKLIVRHYEVRVGTRGAVGAETCQRLHDGLGPADAWNSDDMASF